jgi:hypothetical protein
MEIAVLWFLSMVAINTEVENNKATIMELEQEVALNEKWIKDLEEWNSDLEAMGIKTAAAHSSFYAGQQIKNDDIGDRIDMLEDRMDIMEMEK